jgi:hypothetical protein
MGDWGPPSLPSATAAQKGSEYPEWRRLKPIYQLAKTSDLLVSLIYLWNFKFIANPIRYCGFGWFLWCSVWLIFIFSFHQRFNKGFELPSESACSRLWGEAEAESGFEWEGLRGNGTLIYLFICYFFIWWDWSLNSGLHTWKQVLYHLNHTSSPFCSGYFGDGVLWTICPGWPPTIILLISAFQVARITGMSH